jgi:hypothetical protein
MNSKPANIQQLFNEALNDGVLSNQAANALNVPDIGKQIQAGLGIHVDDVTSSEVVLVTMMPDDSGSIRFAGNSQIVCDGHNTVLDALNASKQKGDILAHTRYLNGDVLFPYNPLDQATEMNSSNYNPDKGTPLYDQAVILLGTVLAKSQEFARNGVPVRTVTLIISDGGDAHSTTSKPKDVAAIVRSMLKTESHLVVGMGIDDGSTDFHQVYKDMGIPDEWILTPGNTPSEIRKAFQVFSQSAVQASKSALSFKQVSMGGGFAATGLASKAP